MWAEPSNKFRGAQMVTGEDGLTLHWGGELRDDIHLVCESGSGMILHTLELRWLARAALLALGGKPL